MSKKLLEKGWKQLPNGWVSPNAPFTPPMPEETALKIEEMLADWDAMDTTQKREHLEGDSNG